MATAYVLINCELGSEEAIISQLKNLEGVIAYKEANYSEMKAILQSILKIGFKIDIKTKTPKDNVTMFADGRHSDVLVDEKIIGSIGELSPNVLENFKIRTSVVGFEIKLSGLIFD